jgi:PAS domain S-box-containing protein
VKKERLRFRSRILLWILLPVLAVGIIISALSISYLTPPLISLLKNHIDANLKLASNLGITICENSFNYLLDLRLENDSEMNAALKKQAMEEIKGISRQLHKIHMVVFEDNQNLIGSSLNSPPDGPIVSKFEIGKSTITMQNLYGYPVRTHHQYFPFWNWTIVSFISEADYMAPILLVKKILYIGTLGVLFLVFVTLFLVFNVFVNLPLKRVIAATKGVAGGKYQKIDISRNDEIGQLVYSFNSMVDSLEKKDLDVTNLLDALKTSEDRFRALFENSPMGIGLSDSEGRVLECNDSMFRLLGYTNSEMDQIDLKNCYKHPEDRHLLVKRINHEQIVRNFELEMKRKDGTLFSAKLTMSQFLIGDNKVFLSVTEDVTKEKHLETQLQRAQKMEAIGTLAGGVAHDLNNILSGIVSYPELLLMDLPSGSPFKKPILTIQKSGEKAAAIVQDLLTLGRRGVAITEAVNLNHTVSEYINSPEQVKLQSFHPRIKIETRLGADLLNILGSPVHLTKTVMNLVSNAFEAIVEGGKVIISTTNQYIDKPVRGYDEVKDGDYVVLTISDNGIGMFPEEMGRIFEPFYTKKVMGRSGTGLGMAVVWGAVKDHNGYIDIKSTKDIGTTYTLYFPVTRRDLEKIDSTVSIKDYMGEGESILIVDDVEEQREIATVMLKKLGYSVTSVSSGEKAVAHMTNHSVDLIVLDMIMDPGINGRETYERIIKLHPHQKAIVASGFSESDDVKIVQELGACQYIKKPYILEKIGIAVKEELEKRECRGGISGGQF